MLILDSDVLDFKFMCHILGLSQHSINIEQFYTDLTYKPLSGFYKESFEVIENGQIKNIFESKNHLNSWSWNVYVANKLKNIHCKNNIFAATHSYYKKEVMSQQKHFICSYV